MLVPQGQFKVNAPLKSQCSKNFFYSEDTIFEDQLSQLEGQAEQLFKKICEQRYVNKGACQKSQPIACRCSFF
jgi:hypothetical protein